MANVLDLNRLKWSGANSFRTSHYPYSEEMMRRRDREGIVVIDETSAVGLMENFNFNLMIWRVAVHGGHGYCGSSPSSFDRTYWRDKNHACVVMWSIANEGLRPIQEHGNI